MEGELVIRMLNLPIPAFFNSPDVKAAHTWTVILYCMGKSPYKVTLDS